MHRHHLLFLRQRCRSLHHCLDEDWYQPFCEWQDTVDFWPQLPPAHLTRGWGITKASASCDHATPHSLNEVLDPLSSSFNCDCCTTHHPVEVNIVTDTDNDILASLSTSATTPCYNSNEHTVNQINYSHMDYMLGYTASEFCKKTRQSYPITYDSLAHISPLLINQCRNLAEYVIHASKMFNPKFVWNLSNAGYVNQNNFSHLRHKLFGKSDCILSVCVNAWISSLMCNDKNYPLPVDQYNANPLLHENLSNLIQKSTINTKFLCMASSLVLSNEVIHVPKFDHNIDMSLFPNDCPNVSQAFATFIQSRCLLDGFCEPFVPNSYCSYCPSNIWKAARSDQWKNELKQMPSTSELDESFHCRTCSFSKVHLLSNMAEFVPKETYLNKTQCHCCQSRQHCCGSKPNFGLSPPVGKKYGSSSCIPFPCLLRSNCQPKLLLLLDLLEPVAALVGLPLPPGGE